MLHTKYQGCSLYGFRQEDFFMFSLYKKVSEYDQEIPHVKAYVKHVAPRVGPFLAPRALF